MTPEVQQKAQNLQKEMALLKNDAREFRHNLNMAALRSKSPEHSGTYALAQYLKKIVDAWEEKKLSELQRIYDAL